MEFGNKIWICLFVTKAIKDDAGRLLIAFLTLATLCKLFGFKITILLLFGVYIVQPIQAVPPTTLQRLRNNLLYIRFRIHYNWLQSGFGRKQYEEMETALINAIIQLQQLATPPPTMTTTELPTNDEFCTFSTTIHSTNKQKKGRRSQSHQDSHKNKKECMPQNNKQKKVFLFSIFNFHFHFFIFLLLYIFHYPFVSFSHCFTQGQNATFETTRFPDYI